MERRLAAILATDVVGYSRLIRADEEGMIAALKALRTDLVEQELSEINGRIVKLMGDGMWMPCAPPWKHKRFSRCIRGPWRAARAD